MWVEWQDKVKASLPNNYASSPIYIEQGSQTADDASRVAAGVWAQKGGPIDIDGALRDVKYGAMTFSTPNGGVTRAWLDSNVEIDFIKRNVPAGYKIDNVLDVGAGYGRLAITMATLPEFKTITCVDAVPISTVVCDGYVKEFDTQKKVTVLSIDQFWDVHSALAFDIAVNVHSWNECHHDQVQNWVETLAEMRVPLLLTVSHGSYRTNEKPYYSWGNSPSWRPVVEKRYELITEESIGLSWHPHALWKLRA